MPRFFGTYDDWKLSTPEDDREDFDEPPEDSEDDYWQDLDDEDWLEKLNADKMSLDDM